MNLKKLRENQKLSQLELANILGIKKTTYWGYENETREMGYSMLSQLADFFDCSIDYLLGHQTQNTLQLEGLSETQLKLVDMIKILTPEQAYFALGYFSDMLKIPYSQVRPTRPF